MEPEAAVDILLVDDSADNLTALEAILEPLGQRLVKVRTGKDALRLLLRNDFAVILLDVNMPILDGFETAALIRGRPRSEHTPIIFITAHQDETHVARGYQLGAVDYILTPVVPDVLRAKVGVFVDLFRKTERVRSQARMLSRHAEQQERLARAALAVNASTSLAAIAEVVAQEARALVRAPAAVVEIVVGPRRRHRATSGTTSVVRSVERTLPLIDSEGRRIGQIELTAGEDFGDTDDATLFQLTQMASLAIQNLLYSEERETNRLKDEFMATVSHELRTPLNAILTWVGLLRAGRRDATERALEVIERSARAQGKLIDDLLDMTRIISGRMPLNLDTVDARGIVVAAVDSVTPSAAARRITLETEHADGPLAVVADSGRLRQVFTNLLDNAIKFTPEGGHVRVVQRACGGMIEVAVADDGPGISPEFLPHVFDRFRQADSGTTRRHRGLGLGLSIVRSLVELHGGSVTAESGGEGLGSTFRVRIPVASAPEAPLPGEDPGIAASESPRPLTIAGARVLLVEDDPDASEALALLLANSGALVRTAESVGAALRILDEWVPDIVLSDIGLPGEDGYGLLRALDAKSRAEQVDVPAVALTAYAQRQERARALAAGFRAHLSKPVSHDDLLATLAALLAGRRGSPSTGAPCSSARSTSA